MSDGMAAKLNSGQGQERSVAGRMLPRFLRFPDRWSVATVTIAMVAAAPVFVVLYLAIGSGGDIWAHLSSTVLPRYVRTTLALMIGVGVGTLLIGVGTAWLSSMCDFTGRRIFEWALLLPLAVPAYVVAYVYTDILEFAGPVQGMLRDAFGWSTRRDYWFPEIRSLGGAITVMTLVLYPYVYLLARAAFLEQSACVLEVGRTLGRGPWRGFYSIALPLARPAIVVGVSLVLMETLNDFGTVDFFAVQTFTLGIYDVWLNMNSVTGAAQLASVLLVFVVVLLGLERAARKQRRFHHTTGKYRPLPRYRLKGSRGTLAFAACAIPLVLGFVVPALVLLVNAASHLEVVVDPAFHMRALSSFGLSAFAAILAVMVGTVLAYGNRLHPTPLVRAATRMSGLGYAVPGAVLAVGVIVPLAAFDRTLANVIESMSGVTVGLIISGTLFALAYGYMVRFLALANGTVDAGLAKITPSMDDAARTLGQGAGGVLRRVHLPLLRGSLLTAAVLVFVDCMKELPMTMILRPFGFQTLATLAHQYASDEMLAQAAPAALSIVATGILPVILLSRAIARSRPGEPYKEKRQ
ncbi:MAG: iron ABC transporter permease [Rhodospirillales bacterium]|nr:iron ABC transporter permease [Rhodospirillales bacterium]